MASTEEVGGQSVPLEVRREMVTEEADGEGSAVVRVRREVRRRIGEGRILVIGMDGGVDDAFDEGDEVKWVLSSMDKGS